MSDKSDLKAELERKKQRLAQIREEKKRKEEERKKKEVNVQNHLLDSSCLHKELAEVLTSQYCTPQGICHVEWDTQIHIRLTLKSRSLFLVKNVGVRELLLKPQRCQMTTV